MSTTRKAGMDYGTYKAMCAAKKTAPLDEDAFKALPIEGGDDDAPAEPDGDEDGEGGGGDNEPDGDEPDEDAEKGVKLGDLRKALGAFDTVADATRGSGGSRETYLSARLSAGTISKSERSELGRIWAGTTPDSKVDGAGRPLRKSLTDYLDPEDQNVVNAAPLLKGLFGGLNERLDAVQTRGESNYESLRQLVSAEGQLIKAMGGALVEMSGQLGRRDRVIKALEARLGIVEKTPVAPRAVRSAGTAGTVARPLAKSVSGGDNGKGAPGGSTLQKGQVVRGFHMLVKAAGEGGDFGTASRLTDECAVFERTSHLSPGTRAAIEAVSG